MLISPRTALYVFFNGDVFMPDIELLDVLFCWFVHLSPWLSFLGLAYGAVLAELCAVRSAPCFDLSGGSVLLGAWLCALGGAFCGLLEPEVSNITRG